MSYVDVDVDVAVALKWEKVYAYLYFLHVAIDIRVTLIGLRMADIFEVTGQMKSYYNSRPYAPITIFDWKTEKMYLIIFSKLLFTLARLLR